MADTIMTPAEFRPDATGFGQTKLNASGAKSIRAYKADNRDPITIEMEATRAPFGIQQWTDNGKHSIMVEVAKDSELYKKMMQFDEVICRFAHENQADWFKKGKNMSMETLAELQTPIIQHYVDRTTGERSDKYEPSMKLNIPFDMNGNCLCEFYSADQQQIKMEDLVNGAKGARVTCIIQCQGIWVSSKFGCTWRVAQMMVEPMRKDIKGFAFKNVPKAQPSRPRSDQDDEDEVAQGAMYEGDDDDI
jgi:hypothetical protein